MQCSARLDPDGFERHPKSVVPDYIRFLLDRLEQLQFRPHQGGIRRIEVHVPEVAALATSD